MKIVFLTRLYYPHIGGVEKHVREVSKRLITRGHQVKIITEQYDSDLKKTEYTDGIEVHRFPGGNKWSTWKWMELNKQILDWADIIHAHDVYFWIIPYKLTHPFKKTFLTFHGWEEEYPIPFKNIIVRKLSELLAVGNICVGDFIGKWYKTKPDYVTYGAV